MAYNDTPLPNETPSNSQPFIRQNFTAIANSWNTDHIPLSSGTNVGYSNKLTLVDQGGSPPAGVAGTDVLYSRTVNALIEMFLQRPAGTAIQMTSGTTKQGSSVNFWQTFLPGGLQMRIGISSGNFTYVANGLDNFPTATIGVVLTGQSTATQNVTGTTNLGFNVSGSGNYYFIAIGY